MTWTRKMKNKKDRLLKIERIYDLTKYKSYEGNGDYSYDIKGVEKTTTKNLDKHIIKYNKFIVSSNTGGVVMGLLNKDYQVEGMTMSVKGISEFRLTPTHREYIGEEIDKIYDYIDEDYFENSDQYNVYDVEKDIIMTYIGVFSLVCYDSKNTFLWGKILNSGVECYFVDATDLLDIRHHRRIKIQNFLEREFEDEE